MSKIENLNDLLINELKDLLNAETQLTRAIPKLIKLADSEELQSALEKHLEETKQQKDTVEEILTELTGSARGKTCKGIQGIIEEGNELMEELESHAVCDAAIIAAAQKVEHYEIASYGTVREWAEKLGLDDVASRLQKILDQEAAANEKMTEIAVSMANEEAAEGEDDEDEQKMEGGEEEEEESTTRATAGAKGRSESRGGPGRSNKNGGGTGRSRTRSRGTRQPA